ncbi:nucleoside deaminase [Amnibacterium endophyticum]|uniref:Nucleoside deaminase n=1 Tax=Amnibacterium endophyticum TaxID=2109337 RepID=A0ABW4LI19_9MICO
MSTTDHDRFMRIAIGEAHRGAAMGEQPFGAVAVLGGEVIAQTPSLKVSRCDATAHSETLCAGMATRAAGRRHLPDATFYATCEPCPMCLGAVFAAGFGTLVVGARNADIRVPGRAAFNFRDYSIERFVEMVGWDLALVTGVRSDECVELYRTAAVELTR